MYPAWVQVLLWRALSALPQPLLKVRRGGAGEAMPPPLSGPLLGKNGLGQEGMDPLRPIDDLGHH